jgi:hypothetical protein
MPDLVAALAGLKLAAVLPALAGASLAILLELRRHTWATALLALASGAAVAWAGTDPLVAFFQLEQNAAYAVAGVLGVTGRNLIVWLLNVSRDPLKAWRDRNLD